MEKSVLLLGQTFQASTYHRRFNSLSDMVKDNRKIKYTLKEKGDLLQNEHKKLFGEKFQTYITDTVKLRQTSEELLRDMNKKKPVRQPFRSPPHRHKVTKLQWGGGGGGVQSYLPRKQTTVINKDQIPQFLRNHKE